MNISIEITAIGSNSSSYSNDTTGPGFKHWFLYSIICVASVLFGFPTNSYVIWLIVTGKGNGLAAEFFSLNLSISEMIYSLQSLFQLLLYTFPDLSRAVNFFQGIATTGRPLFQCLICVERYLAVVHPVIFLKYKPLRYKVICSVIVWVASLSGYGLVTTVSTTLRKVYFCRFHIDTAHPLPLHPVVLSRGCSQSSEAVRTRRERERERKKTTWSKERLSSFESLLWLWLLYMFHILFRSSFLWVHLTFQWWSRILVMLVLVWLV